ncbi:MAG: CDP-diacylglycerol--serine O-phosphatidyltransferase [Bacteroidia bacterium]
MVIAHIAWLIPALSAVRLAKFNIDTRQTTSFIGVPTPANAILIGSLPLVLAHNPSFEWLIRNPFVLIAITIVMSLLLVAELPLFALKFKNYTFGDNKIRFIFLILSIIILITFQFAGVPLIILSYILLSLIDSKSPASS